MKEKRNLLTGVHMTIYTITDCSSRRERLVEYEYRISDEIRYSMLCGMIEKTDGTHIGDLCFKGIEAGHNPEKKAVEAEADPDNATSQRVLVNYPRSKDRWACNYPVVRN